MATFKGLDDSVDAYLNSWSHLSSNDFFDQDEEMEVGYDGEEENGNEEIQIGSEVLTLSSALFRGPETINEIFSTKAWDSLPPDEQKRLLKFLPDFGGASSDDEQQKTVAMLLTGQNIRFGNPIEKFKSNLLSGKLSPDSVKMFQVIQRAQYRKYRAMQVNYNYTNLRHILSSRKRIIESRTSKPAKTPLAVLRMKRKTVKSRAGFEFRVSKRYFRELKMVRGENEEESSEDENYPNGPPKAGEFEKKEVSLLDADFWQSLTNGKSGHETRPASVLKERLEKSVTRQNPTSLLLPFPPKQDEPKLNLATAIDHSSSTDDFNNHLATLPKTPLRDLPALPNSMLSPNKVSPIKVSPIKFSEPLTRPSDEISLLRPHLNKQQEISPTKPRKQVNDLQVIEEAVANIPGMDLGDALGEDFDLDFCFDSLEQTSSVSKQSWANRSSCTIGTLLSPTHQMTSVEGTGWACFFSLIRDKFRTSLDYKMTIEELEASIEEWESQDNSNLSWILFSNSWADETRSAVAFLSNHVPEMSPHNFSPYLNRAGHAYQWIGTGRDADVQLQSVCQYWFDRRHLFSLPNEISSVEFGLQEQEQVSGAAAFQSDGIPDFHTQERERLYNPTQPYTYRFKDFSVIVGPVRAPTGHLSLTPAKGKSHPLLVPERPAYITIIVLVRDAVARLRNGEGTRSNICELVKESQFINQDVAREEKILTSAVSGALDRLQGETDPCCKYDTSKKTWQYLHLGRTAEDFLRIAAELQTTPKSSKPKKARVSSTSGGGVMPSPIIETTTTTTVITNQEDVVMKAVSSILPSEPLLRSEIPTPSVPLQAAALPNVTSVATASLPSESLATPVVSQPVTAATPVSSVQVVQIMTSQGLKTFKLSSTAAPPEAAGSAQQVLPVQANVRSSQSELSPVRAAAQQVGIRLSTSQGVSSPVVTTITSPLSGLRPDGPPKIQNVQRFLVKDSEGKPIQISSEALQKLIAVKSVRPAGQAVTAATIAAEPKPSTFIRVQRPPQQIQTGGDSSVVRVVKRPLTATAVSPQRPGQQVIKLQSVQLMPGSSSGVRLVQPTSTPTALTGSPTSIVSIGGKQYILANSQTAGARPQPQQIVVSSSQPLISTQPSAIRIQGPNVPQQSIVRQTGPSQAARQQIPPGHVVVQSANGKTIVISKDQLKGLRIVQQK